jgi:glucan phosphoethanolaminetransferase (alkaline phosphatase superfamily)
MWQDIKLDFATHELWVLKQAKKLPIMGMFFVATLLFCGIIPLLLITPLHVFLIETFPKWYPISRLLLLPILVMVYIWVMRWYIICIALVFGARGMARRKEEELIKRIERLGEQ